MAAQPEDYFQEVGTPGSATYMTAPGYTIGATTMNVQSTSGFPSDTGVIFSVDTTSTVNGVETQDAGSYCVFEGKVASATSLSGVSLLYGTPQNYPAGATTRVYITVSTQWAKRLVEGLLVSHTQFGTLKNNAVATANIADDAVTTAKIADDAVTNAKIADSAVLPENLLTGTGTSWAWQSWTPTLTNLSGGTLNYAKYTRVGKTVHFRFKYTLGGAGMGTDPRITLPIAPHADYVASDTYQINGQLNDATGLRWIPGVLSTSGGATITIFYYTAASVLNAITATAPFTWAVNDQIMLSGVYEGV